MKSLMLLVEMSKAAESLSDTTAAQLKATLHQSKYVLLKAEKNLRQQLKLEALRKLHLA